MSQQQGETIQEKVGAAMTSGIEKVKDFDQQHHISETVVNTAQKVGTKVQEFDQQHHVSENISATAHKVGEKISEGAQATGSAIKKFDEDHHISETVVNTAHKVGEKVKDFDQEHHISETVVNKAKEVDAKCGITDFFKAGLEKVKGFFAKTSGQPATATTTTADMTSPADVIPTVAEVSN